MEGLAAAFDGVFKLAILGVVCLPLAIWKLIDIAIWIFTSVEVNIK